MRSCKGTCYLGRATTKETANAYDPSKLIHGKEFERALEIAEALGLRVVGWIYSYAYDRQNVVMNMARYWRGFSSSLCEGYCSRSQGTNSKYAKARGERGND